MPFPIFNRNSLAFCATLAATLTLFASSLFYNRIEAPLAILILIAAILLRRQLFTHFDKVKILLIVHTTYAISLLSNGINFGSRTYTSFDFGISNFATVMMVSFTGVLFYLITKLTNVRNYYTAIIFILATILFVYCNLNDGRTFDLTGRYVLTVGFLLTMLSLCYLATFNPSDKYGWIIASVINSFTLFVIFVGIESRAMFLSLLASWAIAILTLRHKIWQKLAYTLFPVVFCIGMIVANSNSESDLSRYNALYSLLKVMGFELSLTEDLQETDKIQDNSISTRYLMLKVGLDNALPTWYLGQGNKAEKEILTKFVGERFSTLHNLYLSYFLEGGILHLLIGLTFIIAPFVADQSATKLTLRRKHFCLIMFACSFMLFESHVQLIGFQNLYIMYSFLMFSMLEKTAPRTKAVQ